MILLILAALGIFLAGFIVGVLLTPVFEVIGSTASMFDESLDGLAYNGLAPGPKSGYWECPNREGKKCSGCKWCKKNNCEACKLWEHHQHYPNDFKYCCKSRRD